MKARFTKLLREEDGVIAVIMAFVLVLLLSLCAVVIDLGMVYAKRSSLQNAIDSAVLAGAYQLPDTALATTAANEYIIKNGFSPSDIEILFEYDNSVIKINAATRAETSFSRVFNIDYVDIDATASAKKDVMPFEPALDYLLFSGSQTATLNMGGRFEIYGSVHSNGGLNASPSYGYIENSVESRTSFYVNPWTTTVGTQVLGAPSIEMPDFSGEITNIMPSFYETVVSGSSFTRKTGKAYITGNTKIVGDVTFYNQAVISGNLYVEGNLVIGGPAPACELNGNIYATGTITFTNTFYGSGCVFAGGNILFQGGSAQFAANSPICIYSEHGNISLTTGTTAVHGMIYAPLGTVNVQGGTTIFYGSIIGNQITGIPADLRMYLLDVQLPFETAKTVTRLVE